MHSLNFPKLQPFTVNSSLHLKQATENITYSFALVIQLQGLVAELREGFHAALTELCELRQRDQGLEEKLQAHQTDVDDKIMGLKNSLNTFKVQEAR